MNPETVNYFRLEILFNESVKVLQAYFRRFWEINMKQPWVDGPACGQQLHAIRLKSPHQSLKPDQIALITNGDSSLWDVTLVNDLLGSVCKVRSFSHPSGVDRALGIIRKGRNRSKHSAKCEISASEFQITWGEVVEALSHESFGFSKIRADLLLATDISGDIRDAGDPAKQLTNAQAMELWLRAQEAEGQGNMNEASQLVAQALVIAGQTDAALAVLHCRKAEILLRQSHLKPATGAAKTARRLAPLSWHAHFILARCYENSEKKLAKAVAAYSVAFGLNPDNVEVRRARDACHLRKARADQERALNTSDFPRTVVPPAITELMGGVSPAALNPAVAQNIDRLIPGQVACAKGQQFRYGDPKHNISVENTRALSWFGKAAGSSPPNPEGLYHLALMQMDGIGGPRNYLMALMTLKRAANSPPFHDPPFKGLPRQGVWQAQHVLGLLSFYGMETPKDVDQAVAWFQSASDIGSLPSAHFLGLMYLNGDGVAADVTRGVQLLTKAAEGGNTAAMMTLYEHGEEKWLQPAADAGDPKAKKILENIS